SVFAPLDGFGYHFDSGLPRGDARGRGGEAAARERDGTRRASGSERRGLRLATGRRALGLLGAARARRILFGWTRERARGDLPRAWALRRRRRRGRAPRARPDRGRAARDARRRRARLGWWVRLRSGRRPGPSVVVVPAGPARD